MHKGTSWDQRIIKQKTKDWIWERDVLGGELEGGCDQDTLYECMKLKKNSYMGTQKDDTCSMICLGFFFAFVFICLVGLLLLLFNLAGAGVIWEDDSHLIKCLHQIDLESFLD